MELRERQLPSVTGSFTLNLSLAETQEPFLATLSTVRRASTNSPRGLLAQRSRSSHRTSQRLWKGMRVEVLRIRFYAMLTRYLIGYSPISLNDIALPIVFRESYKRLDNLTEAMAIEIDIEQRTYRFLLKYPYPLPPYDYVNIYILGAAAGCRLYAFEDSEPLFGVSVKDSRKYWLNIADKTSKVIMDYLKSTAVEVETAEDFKFLTREVEGGNT